MPRRLLKFAAPMHRMIMRNELAQDFFERFNIVMMDQALQRMAIKILRVQAGDRGEIAREVGAAGFTVNQAQNMRAILSQIFVFFLKTERIIGISVGKVTTRYITGIRSRSRQANP